jgi:hypothetical protein
MPSPLQEAVISAVSRGITEATIDLPGSVKNRLRATTGEDWNGFEGEYAASEKRADLAIKFTPPNGLTRIGLVVEVGGYTRGVCLSARGDSGVSQILAEWASKKITKITSRIND